MLCDVELPPTAPHPNVKAGTKLIVAPIPPRALVNLLPFLKLAFLMRIS